MLLAALRLRGRSALEVSDQGRPTRSPCPPGLSRALAVGLLPPAALLLAACSLPWGAPPAVERGSPARATRTVRVARGEINGVLVYSGDLRAKPSITVTPRISGRLERMHVETGSLVREGDTVAELDRAALEVQVTQGQANLAAAEARLAGLQAGDEPEARAESEARLRAARARLTALQTAPRAETIPYLVEQLRESRRLLAELESNNADGVARAEERVTTARTRLDRILTGVGVGLASPTPGLDRVAIEQARAEIRQAEEELARARRPITSEEIAGARQQVSQAEEDLLLARNPIGPLELEEASANVEAAEIRLRGASTAVTPATIKAAESAVSYAWAALELARLQLREATIVAPIAGLVAETHQRAGAGVAAGTPLLSIQPPDYELVLAVEDRQLSQLQIGHGMNVVVDAYPGESFNGTLRSIAPTVDVRTRTVAAKVDVLDPQLKLKAGLFAQAAVQSGRKPGALLLPREAVVSGPESSVLLVVEGRAQRRPVQLGVTDGRNVEILQGVSEGAEIVLPVGVADGDLVGER